MSPAATRTADVTIFGATGFTGRFVAAEAVRSLPHDVSITIAGRSTAKLNALVQQLNAGDRLKVLGDVDVSDAASVKRMAEGTRLLLNCVGPFRHWGEVVFAACAAAGTDYLDIAGEPEFIEGMQLRHHSTAGQTGALMACAAGFDSVPADMGTLFAARAFPPPAVPSAVEAVIQFNAPMGTKVHYATWEAAVHGMGSVAALRALRRQAAAAGLNPKPKLVGPRPHVAEGPSWDERVAAWTLPFPGADVSIVRRTQSALSAAGEPAVHFSARFAAPSTAVMLRFVLYGAVIMTLAKWGWGRALLLKYPGLFSAGLVSHERHSQKQMEAPPPPPRGCSMRCIKRYHEQPSTVNGDDRHGNKSMYGSLLRHVHVHVVGHMMSHVYRYPGLFSGGLVSHEGPSQKQMEAATTRFTFFASGYSSAPAAGAAAGKPDKQVLAEVSFGDPGYLYTSKMFIQTALTLLHERQQIVAAVGATGGVFTVGALFRHSSLIDRLQQAGVKFTVKQQ